MRYILQTLNLALSDTDQKLLEKKIRTLYTLCRPPYKLKILLSRDTHHRQGDVITCIINIVFGKKNIHVTRQAATIQLVLDSSLAAARKSLLRYKTTSPSQEK
jgi:ribosome-associated translation inhibitor RaiA